MQIQQRKGRLDAWTNELGSQKSCFSRLGLGERVDEVGDNLAASWASDPARPIEYRCRRAICGKTDRKGLFSDAPGLD